MSAELIARSPDLKRLRDKGYNIAIRGGYLLVRGVPYVNNQREIRHGVLVSKLNLSGQTTATPGTHVIHFSGEHPCRSDGSKLTQITNRSHPGKALCDGLTVDHTFSAKPEGGRYRDYYEKVTRYARILGDPARALDPSVTAEMFTPVAAEGDDSAVFHYLDTASSRADIMNVSEKLEMGAVAIVGVGGTGSYVLDYVAKTPVAEIRLIDDDVFYQHNAFRAPGAPSIEELRAQPRKVDYLRKIYGRMHRNIVAHPCRLSAANLHLLEGLDFAFLCFDDGPVKKVAIETLLEAGTKFVDVGMGLDLLDDSVTGLLRVTTGTPEHAEHILDGKRISFAPADEDDEYSTNIQVADLNALNAALAVIKWKKLFGFYLDLEHEFHTTYAVNGNEITNEDGHE